MQTVTFNHPYRTAAGVADTLEVAGLYDLALAGRGFFLDLASDRLQIQSLPITRQQTDIGEKSGPGSLASTEEWRKQSRSWHEGAGQVSADEEGSSEFRYLSSKGINPWDKWELTLLNDTSLVVADADTTQTVLTADGVLYHQAGSVIRKSTDGVSWSAHVTVADPASGQMVTDGIDLYIPTTVDIKKVTSGAVASSAFAVAGAQVIGFSKGRMWAGAADDLYWMTPDSPTPTVAMTAPWGSTSWEWTAICDGLRGTYASGFAGDRSHVYRVPLSDDGASLGAGVEAWTAPDGELVTGLTSYLGFIVLGTTLGVRFAVADGSGDLTPGSYIPTSQRVLAFEPQDRFVWFGWSAYDTDSSGLGRLDLSVFTNPLTPGYASDLMYDAVAGVTSICTALGRRFFTLDGVGLVAELEDTPVPTGSLTTSAVTFGLDDEKLVTALDLSHRQLDGTVSLGLVLDDSATGTLIESSRQGSLGPNRTVGINPVTATRVAVTVTMTPGTGTGPEVIGWKLLARPQPPVATRFLMPLMLATQHDSNGVYVSGDPQSDLLFLMSLWRVGDPVILQWGGESFTVFVTNFEWTPYRQTDSTAGWAGTCVMELREVAR